MTKQIKASLDEIVAETVNSLLDNFKELHQTEVPHMADVIRTALERFVEEDSQLSGISGYVDWIRVEDQHPIPYMEVLVTDGVEVRSGYYDDDYKKLVMRKAFQFKHITHWRPLPLPPTPNQEGGQS